jgi:superfamily II DNA or RNA helicase
MILRDYQLKAVDRSFEEWETNSSTLIVVPTGGGKTQIFSEIVRRMLPKRSLVLVHREELAFQARTRIEKIADIKCEIEMAEMRSETNLFDRTPCVIASVQTLYRRLDKFDPSDFGLLICDEAHHSTSATWRMIIDHFRQNDELKVLGVTATPDRSDEEALGQIFETVAFDYEILDAINDGWLVPVDQQMVSIGGLDFSAVRTTAGDLNGADLASVMESEKNVQGMVGSSIEIIGDRSSILFASSIVHAQMACSIFNRHKEGMAAFVCGTTERDDRRRILANFQDGTTQVLCNVGIATEGFDAPRATVVLNGRPTESRALYSQMAGRVLRPLTGLVDGLPTPDERKRAIAESSKPAALLIDFVGNSGKHKLMSSGDILGGNVSEEAIELAMTRARAAKGAVRISDLLEESEAKIKEEREARRKSEEARKARLVARVAYTKTSVNPFDVFDLSPIRERGWDSGRRLSEKQRNVLVKQGINVDEMPYVEAKAVLNEMFRRWDKKLSTMKQCVLLNKHGYQNTAKMTMQEASQLIDALAKNGWKRPTANAA